MRLIYRQGNYGSICFPYGRLEDGGSCQFATTECLEECSERYSSYDGREEKSWFIQVMDFFYNNSTITIYKRIVNEMKKNKFTFLSWFDCGDCPTLLTSKIAELIEQLSRDGYTQIGFTRNVALWVRVRDLDNVRFMFTTTSIRHMHDEGWYAVADFVNQLCTIYHRHTVTHEDKKNVIVTYCGGGCRYASITETVNEVVGRCGVSSTNISFCGSCTESNCFYCHQEKKGCFTVDD